MRDGVHDALLTPPSLPPYLPPPLPPITTAGPVVSHNMILSIFLAVFLPCVGMSLIFVIYICLLWYASNHRREAAGPVKPEEKNGLSASELEKLPKMSGKELVLGNECAVCLDEIGSHEAARVVPGCNHGFHLKCADTWLSKHSVCPVCRTVLDPQFFNASEENPC